MTSTEPTEILTMTWREKLVCRILLIIAKMVAPGPILDDVKHLASHISVAREGDRV